MSGFMPAMANLFMRREKVKKSVWIRFPPGITNSGMSALGRIFKDMEGAGIRWQEFGAGIPTSTLYRTADY